MYVSTGGPAILRDFLFLAQTGNAVFLDNLAVHKSTKAAQGLKNWGAWFPHYNPDLNPIEMAFSKITAHLRAAALPKILGSICNLFKRTTY